MAKTPTPTPLTTATANYGWTKPDVGASVDAWGDMLNADLDGIDTTVKSVSTVANAAYPASNPAGYITAAAIPPSYVLPTASTTVLGGVKVDGSTVTIAGGTISSSGGAAPSSTPPLMDGIVAVGTGTTFARADHVHPTDTHAIGDNRIINGDMRIDQRGVASGAGGTVTGYTVDRWRYDATQTPKGTWSRLYPSTSLLPFGFNSALSFGSNSTAYTPLATDYFTFSQRIEADAMTDFSWGTPQAQPVTLSFLALSLNTGTYSGAIANQPTPNRSYPFVFSIPAAGVWTKIAVTIPGDTVGTWVLNGNASGVLVTFDLGAGSTFRAPAGAWAAGNFVGANGALSTVAISSGILSVTGVKLEVGSVATPFNRQSLAKSMADCQRYYQTGALYVQSNGSAGAPAQFSVPLKVSMRATPTGTVAAISLGNCSALSLGLPSNQEIAVNATVTAASTYVLQASYTASAEL